MSTDGEAATRQAGEPPADGAYPVHPARHVVGLIAFTLGLIGGFALLADYLHEMSGAASYAMQPGAGRARQGEVSALIGRDLFNGPAGCVACHKVGGEGSGIRGPNLGVDPPDFPEPIAVRAAEAQPDRSAVEHLVQALYEPDAYVAPGFEAGVMPSAHEPPVALDHGQIRSLVLFLFQASGKPASDELREAIRQAQRPWTGEGPSEADGGAVPGPHAPDAGGADAGAAPLAPSPDAAAKGGPR